MNLRRAWRDRFRPALPVVGTAVCAVAVFATIVVVRTDGHDQPQAGPDTTSPSSVAPTASGATAATGSPTSTPEQGSSPPPLATELLGGAPRLWDDFARPDTANLGNSSAPSGQQYVTTLAKGSTMRIEQQRLVPQGVMPRRATVLYSDLKRLRGVTAEWAWQPGQTGYENAVIGSTAAAGFSQGSIQLAVYATTWFHHHSSRWQLYAVTNPITDPYPTLATGTLNMPHFTRDGHTPYHVAMRRTGPDEVTLELPDGSEQVVTDPLIGQYWGNRVGWQLRRSRSTDGSVAFDLIAAN